MINWKDIAKSHLIDYPLKQTAVENLSSQLDDLRLQAESGAGRHAEIERMNRLCREGELSELLDRAKREAWRVDNALAVLEEQDALVLRRMYMEKGGGQRTVRMARLCRELNLGDPRSGYRLLEKALSRFTLAFYGALES